jgi:hypothetical protein
MYCLEISTRWSTYRHIDLHNAHNICASCMMSYIARLTARAHNFFCYRGSKARSVFGRLPDMLMEGGRADAQNGNSAEIYQWSLTIVFPLL